MPRAELAASRLSTAFSTWRGVASRASASCLMLTVPGATKSSASTLASRLSSSAPFVSAFLVTINYNFFASMGVFMNKLRLYMLAALAIFLLAACTAGSPAMALSIVVRADGELREVSLPAGSTVRDALTATDLELGDLDRVEPPMHTELVDGDQVSL